MHLRLNVLPRNKGHNPLLNKESKCQTTKAVTPATHMVPPYPPKHFKAAR